MFLHRMFYKFQFVKNTLNSVNNRIIDLIDDNDFVRGVPSLPI